MKITLFISLSWLSKLGSNRHFTNTILLSIVSLLIFNSTIAQKKTSPAYYCERSEDIAQRTLLVQLPENNELHSNAIKNAVLENWTFSPVEFVDKKALESYYSSDKHSFLIMVVGLTNVNATVFEVNIGEDRFDTLSYHIKFVLGDQKNKYVRNLYYGSVFARSLPSERVQKNQNNRVLKRYEHLFPLIIRDINSRLEACADPNYAHFYD